jgi:hypothetical protein
MNGRLGCSVDSVELNQPEDKQPSVIHNYATTHCIRKKNTISFAQYQSRGISLSVYAFSSRNRSLAIWESEVCILAREYRDYPSSHGFKTFKDSILPILAFKRGLEWRLRLWCEAGDVTSLTILPIEDGRVAGHAVLDKSAISVFNLKKGANKLTSQTTTVPAFQRIRA